MFVLFIDESTRRFCWSRRFHSINTMMQAKGFNIATSSHFQLLAACKFIKLLYSRVLDCSVMGMSDSVLAHIRDQIDSK